jgi:hypothetical protein
VSFDSPFTVTHSLPTPSFTLPSGLSGEAWAAQSTGENTPMDKASTLRLNLKVELFICVNLKPPLREGRESATNPEKL